MKRSTLLATLATLLARLEEVQRAKRYLTRDQLDEVILELKHIIDFILVLPPVEK